MASHLKMVPFFLFLSIWQKKFVALFIPRVTAFLHFDTSRNYDDWFAPRLDYVIIGARRLVIHVYHSFVLTASRDQDWIFACGTLDVICRWVMGEVRRWVRLFVEQSIVKVFLFVLSIRKHWQIVIWRYTSWFFAKDLVNDLLDFTLSSLTLTTR